MRWWKQMRSWAMANWHRARVEGEMEAELRFHVSARAEDLMRTGIARAEAMRRARIEFGGMDQVKEEGRGACGLGFAESVIQDLRFGLRMLRKSPGFTAVAVFTLALGIGASTAIFSLVDAVLLCSLPVRDPRGLKVVQWLSNETHNGGTSTYGDCLRVPSTGSGRKQGCSFSYPMFQEMRGQKETLAGAAAFAGPLRVILAGAGEASVAEAGVVSGDYFEVLRVNPAIGRNLQAEDERRGAEPVVELSYGYWQDRFAGSPAVIGRTIRLNNSPFRVVGVAERAFTRLTPGKAQDLWVPLTSAPEIAIARASDLEDAANWWLVVLCRVKEGISARQAQAATSLTFRNSVVHGAKPLLKETDDPQIKLLPAEQALVGIRAALATPLYILAAAVGILLFISCANVAGLLLARARAREREIAVRTALGGSRQRISRQLLTESLMLSTTGGALGILLAYWGASWLALFVTSNSHSPMVLNVTLHGQVLAFTTLTSTLTGILFGLAPALGSRGVRPSAALKNSAGVATKQAGSRKWSAGGLLVMAQVALSMVVLIGAGLMIRTLTNLKNTDPGFQARNLLHFEISPALAGYPEAKLAGLYAELQRRLAALPGVKSVSYANGILLDGGLWTSKLHIEGTPENTEVETSMLAVGPDYFATMQIPTISGRTLQATDILSETGVALVNETFVRRYLNGRNPVGLRLAGGSDRAVKRTIVGVVGDAKYEELRETVAPTAYVPMSGGRVYFELLTETQPAGLIPSVRQLVGEMNQDLPVMDLRTQTETVDRLLFNERLVARLSALFGALALVLACLGLFGLLSYEVAKRTQEIGVRTALGAPRHQVRAMILRQGLALTLFGIGGGALTALWAMRYLRTLLYGVPAADAATFAVVASLLAAVSVVASWVPARRATRVDPMVALRYE